MKFIEQPKTFVVAAWGDVMLKYHLSHIPSSVAEKDYYYLLFEVHHILYMYDDGISYLTPSHDFLLLSPFVPW